MFIILNKIIIIKIIKQILNRKRDNTSSLKSNNHKYQRDKGGEDAYFVEDNIIAVADGVGGWESQGVDSGLYSK